VHRDIKPQNIILGPPGAPTAKKRNKVYLIDFGLSKEYIDEKKNHVGYQYYSSIVGTALFASLNAHYGSELTRRDDLESLAYSLIYLYIGDLPWKSVTGTKKERHADIQVMKEEYLNSSEAEKVPSELLKFLVHAQSLTFDQQPNY